MEKKLITPWYIIPVPEGPVLYFPRRRAALMAGPGAENLCRKLERAESASLSGEEAKTAGLLSEMGVLGPEPADAPGRALADHITLLPTFSCNLACSYCYVAEEKPPDMSPETAEKAVELGFARAREAGSRFFRVSFHGGEAFTRFPLLRRAVERAQELCREKGMEARFAAASNGSFGQEVRGFVLGNFHGLALSYDGPGEIHDAARPMRSGASSHERLAENIRVLSGEGFPLALRMTLTGRSAPLVEEALAELSRLGFSGPLMLEPVFAGAEQDNRDLCVGPGEFLSAFARAHSLGQAAGIRVSFSPARLDRIAGEHCGAGTGNACVAPDGKVHACLQAAARGGEAARSFLVGDVSAGVLRDEEKSRAIEEMLAARRAGCEGCFAFHHCAGGCPLLQDGADRESEPRCESARAVLLYLILSHIRDAGGLYWKEESGAV